MGAVSSSLLRRRAGAAVRAPPIPLTSRPEATAPPTPRSEPGWGDDDAEAAPVRPLRRHERGRGREGGRGAKATDLHEGRDGGLDRLCKIGVHTP